MARLPDSLSPEPPVAAAFYDEPPHPTCAYLQRGGPWVLCMRRWAPDAWCVAVVAVRQTWPPAWWTPDRPWSTETAWIRWLRSGLVEQDGIWKDSRHARLQRQRGWGGASRRPPGGSRWPRRDWRLLASGMLQAPERLPATVRCPVCGHKRVLDPTVLQVDDRITLRRGDLEMLCAELTAPDAARLRARVALRPDA